MWLLGAGASASSGIPTAGDMIWDFKRTLYCTENKISIRSIPDISNSAVRRQIQQYFDSTGRFPPENSQEEYAYYFETVHRTDSDRRGFIDRAVAGVRPSFGHLVLAALLSLKKASVIWTSNFDRIIEDSAHHIFGTSTALVISTLDSSEIARQALSESRFPLLIKIHGDYQSRRLKNTAPELQAQDANLRDALKNSCQRFGLVISGYSGRDASVMEALSSALVDKNSFPGGLFWIHRSTTKVSEEVDLLIKKAKSLGIDAHLVVAETFDEVMGGIFNLQLDVPANILSKIDMKSPRVSPGTLHYERGIYPLIRTNALPVLMAPTTCRLVTCEMGGYAELRERIINTKANIVAARRKAGVIAFGHDDEIRKALEGRNVGEFNLHSIESRRLRYDSAELGLLYEALGKAIIRGEPLISDQGRGKLTLIIDPEKINDPKFTDLKRAVGGQLAGQVSGTDAKWIESLRLKIEYRLKRIWLLAVPSIWIENSSESKYAAADFVRERQAVRYNQKWNSILDAWITVLLGDNDVKEFRTFGTGSGTDAIFQIGRRSGFSLKRGRSE